MEEKYKKELLSQEYRNMNLEAAMEYYPDVMKKFREIKALALKQIKRSDLAKTEKGEKRKISVVNESTNQSEEKVNVIENLKNIAYDNVDYIAMVCSNAENMPILYAMEILDRKARNVISNSSRWSLNKLVQFTNWSFSDKSYGSKIHKMSLFTLYTLREFIKLEMKQEG